MGRTVLIHNPKKKGAKRNRRVKRVRRFSGEEYYYANDYASKKKAQKVAKQRRQTGAKARVQTVHGRHVVYHRKGRR